MGLVRQDPRIICEYDLDTTFLTRLIIQICTCKMASSIFSAMSPLKFVSTTRAPFLSWHQQKEQMEKMFPLLMVMITMLFLLIFLPPIRYRSHCLLLVGFTVRVPKSGVNYGVILTLPCAPDEDIIFWYINRPSPDLPLHMICSGLVGWGFFHVWS